MLKLNLAANTINTLLTTMGHLFSPNAKKPLQEALIQVMEKINEEKQQIRETSSKIIEKNVEPMRYVTICELLESKLGIECIKPFSSHGREVYNNLMTNKNLETYKIGNARFFKIKSV